MYNMIYCCPYCERPIKEHQGDDFKNCLTELSGWNRTLFDNYDSERDEGFSIVEYFNETLDKMQISIQVDDLVFSLDTNEFDGFVKAIMEANKNFNGNISK